MRALERRFFEYMSTGEVFTADDVTDDGKLAADTGHRPNGKQNTIGSLFRNHARDRNIRPTGEVVRSRAPHRKGGMIRQWVATPKGRIYAQLMLEPNK